MGLPQGSDHRSGQMPRQSRDPHGQPPPHRSIRTTPRSTVAPPAWAERPPRMARATRAAAVVTPAIRFSGAILIARTGTRAPRVKLAAEARDA